MSFVGLPSGQMPTATAYANRPTTADQGFRQPGQNNAPNFFESLFGGLTSNRFGSLYPADNRQLGAFGAPGSGLGPTGNNVPAGGLDWVYQMTQPSQDCMQTTAAAIRNHTGMNISQATGDGLRWGTPEAEKYLARLQALNLPVPLTMSYPGQGHTNADGSGHISWANFNGGQLGLVDCATQQACRYAGIGPDGSVSDGYKQYQMTSILRYSETQLAAMEAQRGLTSFA